MSMPFGVGGLVYYVDAIDGNDLNDGLSPETAFATIQKGIDTAVDYDTVIVAEGTYCENIEFKGKNIILSSTNPMDDDVVGGTVIDGSEANSVVTFSGTENSSCVLRGFTITDGYALDGGGICGNGTMATIQHNVISGNIAERSELLGGQGRGGGLYDCDGLIEKNVVMANQAGGGAGAGGGLYGCDGIIANCLISGNGAILGGGICTGGEMFDPGVPTIVNCTFSGNSAVYGGAVSCSESSYVTIVSSILWGDSAANGPEVAMTSVDFGSHLSVRFSNVQAGQAAIFDKDSLDWGPGNIDADPLFVGADANDYHLLVGSPCINAGDPNYTGQPDDTDLDGNPRIVMGTVDMGAYESQVVYVDDDAPDDPGPGDPDVSDPLENGSQAHPFDAIQEAIDAAESTGTVMVLEGAYTGAGNKNLDFHGKAITVKSSCGPENCTINCEGTEADSHRAFYFHGGEGANSVVDGFTITRGYISDFGGAIKCDNSSPTIANCVFLGNTAPDGGAGGAIGCINSHAMIMNCAITGNSAEGSGGFVFNGSGGGICNLGSNPTINNCTIGGNQASNRGGAIFNLESSPTVHNCILWGDGPDEIFVSDGTPVVSYCDVQGGWEGPGNINADPLSADADANDYHLQAGSPCIDTGDNNAVPPSIDRDLDGNPRIVHGTVDMGAYEYQGVIYVDDDAPGDPGPGDPNVSDPLENGTQAHPFDAIQEGIDVASDGESVGVYPGLYEGITVTSTAGVATIEAPGNYAVSFHYGEDANSIFKNFVVRNSYAGFLFSSSSPTITNVTVVDNNNGALAEEGAQPDISNSIFWNNTEEDLFLCQARYSCIQRGGEGIGNISSDPLFVKAANRDYHLKSEGWRWAGSGWTWDEATSRCTDSGNPGFDLGDEPMTIPRDLNNDYGINLRINMGAYGGTGQASMPPHGWALLADLNNDGIVNWPDLGRQLEDWLSTASERPGDLNRNGFIDWVDYSMLADEWMQVADWVEFVNFAEYWPFAVGNRWDSESMPDAGFTLEITNRFLVNNFEIWEFTNWYGTYAGSYQVIAYYVYVNGGLYATENLSDLDSLPEISGDLKFQYPAQVPIGVPVYIPDFGTVTTRRGTLSSVLEDTCLTVGDFPLGDRDDVLALIGQSCPSLTVFARDLGPMRLYGLSILDAIITE
ncbi:MAG: choice-of-anchor Q domain-containing protein [Planctomycetota bacterium]|jgi:hypothetical protein